MAKEKYENWAKKKSKQIREKKKFASKCRITEFF
jgi:hypothetical protein